MGIFDGCLLASDVDETLVSHGVIPKANLEKIDYFIKEGGIFALSSGRSKEALYSVFEFLDKSKVGPSATANGALIYDFSKDTAVGFTAIGEQGKKLAKYIIENMPEVGIEVHTKDICFVPMRNLETDIHEEYEKIAAVFKSYDEIKDEAWLKVLYLPGTDARRAKLQKIAVELCGETCDFYESIANIHGETKKYIEQMPKGVSKGTALRQLRIMLGIKEGGLFGIGDYYNDVAMLEEVDIPAVTAGAPDDLKAMAKYITCSCADGAVADFIDYLVKNFS